MTGLTSTTVSPSSVSSSRSTPWVEGCWGPMLISIISVRNTVDLLPQPHVLLGEAFQRQFLAQRVPAPLVGQEDAAQVGMPVEDDAEEVEDLALVPVGRLVDRHRRRQRLPFPHVRLEPQPV